MAQRHSEFERIPNELYCTPSWVTEALLSAETFSKVVWEPANGLGHISDVLTAHDYNVACSDITSGDDFLDATYQFRDIISNPPHSHPLAVKFVRHALKLTKPHRGKVAMLLPFAWDTATKRPDLFKNCPQFKARHAITRRIRWANLTQKPSGPSGNFAWFVWDWDHCGPALAGYLP